MILPEHDQEKTPWLAHLSRFTCSLAYNLTDLNQVMMRVVVMFLTVFLEEFVVIEVDPTLSEFVFLETP